VNSIGLHLELPEYPLAIECSMSIPVHVSEIVFDCMWLHHPHIALGDDLMSPRIMRILYCIGMYLVSQHI
jgi:hypothetical protein